MIDSSFLRIRSGLCYQIHHEIDYFPVPNISLLERTDTHYGAAVKLFNVLVQRRLLLWAATANPIVAPVR